MTAFGWKRKAGQNISKDLSTKFFGDSEKEDVSPNLAWIQSFKRKKVSLQENCRLKCEEFKVEGIKLAESQRYQEAVAEWDKALNLAPDDYKILEMKAQLSSPFPAIQAAEKAVKINPRWWIAFQTLGRSQLGIGDLQMAKRSFSKALHLNPVEKELWEEDLRWTMALLKKKEEMGERQEQRPEETPEIVYDDEGYILQGDGARSNAVQSRL